MPPRPIILARDEITFDNLDNLSDEKKGKLGAILKPKIVCDCFVATIAAV